MSPELGVVFRPQSPPEHLRDVAQAAEAAGIAQLWLWEDSFFEGGIATAAAALAWTSRLQVGVGLLPVPLRNPALAAMEIATLARMFPGRFSPGLGHGILEWMAQAGAAVASPMTLLREYTAAVRALLAGEHVTTAGRYVSLDAVALDWPPSTPPPVLVGARGPKTVRLAGELADGLLLDSGATLDAVRAARALVDDVRGGRPFQVVLNVEIDDPAMVDDRIHAAAEAGADVVVLEAPGAAPDPLPLIEALAARHGLAGGVGGRGGAGRG
jgi:alkanesulfonate monooxygenase SsuD/methylene tetrahydromethanopterin reductase-like flavin-dependent oxidoreductase (luciferase family)